MLRKLFYKAEPLFPYIAYSHNLDESKCAALSISSYAKLYGLTDFDIKSICNHISITYLYDSEYVVTVRRATEITGKIEYRDNDKETTRRNIVSISTSTELTKISILYDADTRELLKQEKIVYGEFSKYNPLPTIYELYIIDNIVASCI